MATVTRAAKALPDPNSALDAEPIRDQINNLLTFLEGTNIDEANVDLTGSDGLVGKSSPQTLTGLKTFENETAATSGMVEMAKWGLNPSSGTAADNDGVRWTIYGDDDGAAVQNFAQIDFMFTDVSAGTEDADISFRTVINGTMTEVLKVGSTGFSWSGGHLAVGDDDEIRFGAGTDYWWVYDSGGTALELHSTNISGGTNGVVMDINDGTNDVRFYGGISTDGSAAPTAGILTGGVLTVGVDDTGHDVTFFGATSGQKWLWDESADKMIVTGASSVSGAASFAGAATHTNTLTVGVNDTGHDVQFYGATAGKNWLWDESADKMIVTGDSSVSGAASFAGATTHTNTLTVGVDDTGYDVTFYGATSGKNWLWDASADKMIVTGDFAVTGTTTFTDYTVTGTTSYSGASTYTNTLTVGVDDTGHDVKFFGATSGAYMLWDEDVDDLKLVGAAGLIVPDGQFTLGSTAVTTTGAELNLIDGGTARGTEAVASGDGILINDAGTMRMTNVDTVKTYFFSSYAGGGSIVTTGALNSGSITSGFGTIDTGSSTITTTGVVTAGGFTIGSAAITEAELEILDGASVTTAELNVLDAVTGGTVTASLAVVVDSNKDIGSFRNITLTGELDAGSLDVSGDADIDGTLEADAITLGGTALGSLYSPIAGGSGIVTTGALNSGSITSGFGTIDTGSSTITTTGVITGGGLTIGSAVIVESELEMIDGITAGTAAASKAVVLDGSKNIATIGTIGSGAITSSGVVTATGFTIGSAAIVEAELEIIDGATVTTTELNLIDGDTARGTDAVATGDGLLVNDGGTMKMTNVDTVSTYFASHSVGGSNIATVGTITSGAWQSSTKVASAYLDDDTAHLSTTQTFTGAKTFNAVTSLVAGNTTIASNTITQATGTALNVVLSSSAGDDFTVDTSKLVVSGDSGNVGLGTAAPASLLDVRGTVQVGVSDTGHDVQFHGATAGKNWLWDESGDKMIVTGDASISGVTTLDATSRLSLQTSVNDTQSATHIMFVCLDDENQVWDYKEFMGAVKGSSWVVANGDPPVHGAMWVDYYQDSLIWWDLETNTQYMAFDQSDSGNMIGSALVANIQRPFFLDGKIFCLGDATAGGMFEIDLVRDTGWRYLDDGLYKYQGDIEDRNAGKAWHKVAATPTLGSNNNLFQITAARHDTLTDEYGRPKHFWVAIMKTVGMMSYHPAKNDSDAVIYDGTSSGAAGQQDAAVMSPNGMCMFSSYSSGGLAALYGFRKISNITADWTFARVGASFGRGGEDFIFVGLGSHAGAVDMTFRYADSGEGNGQGVYLGQLIKGREAFAFEGAYGLNIVHVDPVNPEKSISHQIDEEGNHPLLLGGSGKGSSTTNCLFASSLENVTDYGGWDHTLTNNNSVTFTAGVIGNAATFDGVNQSLSDTGDADFNLGTGDWSVSFWFKTASATNPGAMEIVVVLADSTPNDLVDLRFNTNGTFKAMVSDDGGSTSDSVTTAIDLYDAAWHHCVWQRSGSALSLYIDGQKVGTAAISNAAASIDPSELHIGTNRAGAEPYEGQVDDLVIVRTALDEDFIRYNYQRGLSAQQVSVNSDHLPSATAGEQIAFIDADPESGYWVTTSNNGTVTVFNRFCIPIASDTGWPYGCAAIKQFVGQRGGYSLLIGGGQIVDTVFSGNVELVQADVAIMDGGR